MAEQQQLLMCIPFGSPGYVPRPEYTIVDCECGQSMWIGPKQTEKKKTGMRAICAICAYRMFGRSVDQYTQTLNSD